MNFFRAHHGFWTARNRRSLYLGILLLILSLLIQIRAEHYTDRRATNFVGDLFLDNLPVVNLDWIIIEGAILVWIATCCFLAFRPRYLLFGLKTVALFIVTRSIFVTLTHISVYPYHAALESGDIGYRLYSLFTFQGEYFFSGHTGLPFLMALVFWPDKFWRYFFFGISFVFGASVLLAHVHYSIDVFAAPFIAYGIFKIAKHLFREDYAVLEGHRVGS